jgi:hypothetical protein
MEMEPTKNAISLKLKIVALKLKIHINSIVKYCFILRIHKPTETINDILE